MEKRKFKLQPLFVALALASVSSQVLAGAYQLSREYNAVEVGNAGSGGAAIANDASTSYANPAGLVRIRNTQLVFSADPIFSYAKFSGTNTQRIGFLPPYTRSGSASSSVKTIIPALHLAVPLNMRGLGKDKWNFGFSVTVPYGLMTDYGNSSLIRYSSTLAKIQVIDISPSLAYSFNEKISVGAGVDFEHLDLDFRTVLGAPVVNTQLDSLGKNEGNGWGYGYHAGLLYQFNDNTRAGISYRSSVNTNLTGYSSLSGRLVTFPPGLTPRTISSNNFNTRFILPPYTSLSGYHNINSAWTINATAAYTQWTALSGNQTAYNLAGLPPITPLTVLIPQHYQNTWTLAFGGSYTINPMWMLRAGVNFDQSPVKSTERNVTLPDSNRTGIGIGAHFTANKQFSFDGGWTHLFINSASVSTPLVVGSQTSTAIGSYNSNKVDILGIQMNVNFI